jgi:hypothetical protein
VKSANGALNNFSLRLCMFKSGDVICPLTGSTGNNYRLTLHTAVRTNALQKMLIRICYVGNVEPLISGNLLWRTALTKVSVVSELRCFNLF